MLLNRLRRRNVHRRRETIVGALGAVHVIVGVHRRFAAATFAGQLVGAPGDHLVDIHIALGAAAGLPDHQGELLVQLTAEYLVSRLFDQARDVDRQVAVAVVDPRGGFLDQRQGVQHGQRHTLVANREIDQ